LLPVGAGHLRAEKASAPDHVERIARIDSNEASAADLLLVPPGPLKQVTQAVRAARRTAAYQGRHPGFLIAVAPVLGATPAAARQRAAGLTMDRDAIPLIGTPEQIARALMDFYDIGIEHILLRGPHPEQDAVEFGRDLIPLMRRKVAQRDGMLAMLAG
jgi:alkanesulfonate monooxygenase SsuD/methylene tetrahydromethanopterin reductase-like flavin-dependent oxidoreductase (luciferase family)